MAARRRAPDPVPRPPGTGRVARRGARRRSAARRARRRGRSRRPAGHASVSRSASETSSSCRNGLSSSTTPDATTWSRAERASRAEPRPRRTAASTAVSGRSSLASLAMSAEQRRKHLGVEQMELVMLGPAANRREDLLRIGRGEHEHDVVGRLLERLQQRVRRRLREHVHLVDDVDLPASRRRERRPGDEVPHRIDPVVGRRVELVHVEGGASGDVHARLADPARLAVDRVRAVQRLGEDPRRRGLPGPSRPGEEVGVRHPVVPHRVAQGVDDMVLTTRPRQSAADDSAGRATGNRPRSEPTTCRAPRSREQPSRGRPAPARACRARASSSCGRSPEPPGCGRGPRPDARCWCATTRQSRSPSPVVRWTSSTWGIDARWAATSLPRPWAICSVT